MYYITDMSFIRILDVIVEPISSSDQGSVPPWVYALIIVGSALLLVGVAIGIFFIDRRKK